MIAVAIIKPLTKEDGTHKDVDPEEGHEDNPTTSQWVMLKNDNDNDNDDNDDNNDKDDNDDSNERQ